MVTDGKIAEPIALEVQLLRAKLRHGYTLSCDRCGDALTLSSMMPTTLECHLLRTAIEIGWHVSLATANALGAIEAPMRDRDLCPPCVRIANAVPPKSR